MKKPQGLLLKILSHKKEELASFKRRRKLSELKERGEDQGATRGFAAALKLLAKKKQTAIIAEIKRASPSKGALREPFDPLELAETYTQAGAACLSTLTDQHFFKGSNVHLDMVRRRSFLPTLRKDFIIDPWQIAESRAYGSDAILLIAAALEKNQLSDFCGQANELGMDALIEVHDEYDLENALAFNEIELIGINNRDLQDFTVNLDTTMRLAPQAPDDCLIVSESGIGNRADIIKLETASVYSFLIGEALLRHPEPAEKLRELLGETK